MGERPPGDAPLYLKVAAGLTTGALAIAIASPTDLVKVPKHRHTNTSQAGAITTCTDLVKVSKHRHTSTSQAGAITTCHAVQSLSSCHN